MTQPSTANHAPAVAKRLRNFLIALVTSVVLIRLLKPNPVVFGFGTILGLIAFCSLLGYLIHVFYLSRILDPKASVAWLMLVLQLIPFIGIPLAISMVLKAGRLHARSNTDVPSPGDA
jgi:hypothetical protein